MFLKYSIICSHVYCYSNKSPRPPSIWVLGFYKIEALGALIGSLSFALHMVKSLCSCLCLFAATIELYPMDDKMFNDFIIGK